MSSSGRLGGVDVEARGEAEERGESPAPGGAAPRNGRSGHGSNGKSLESQSERGRAASPDRREPARAHDEIPSLDDLERDLARLEARILAGARSGHLTNGGAPGSPADFVDDLDQPLVADGARGETAPNGKDHGAEPSNGTRAPASPAPAQAPGSSGSPAREPAAGALREAQAPVPARPRAEEKSRAEALMRDDFDALARADGAGRGGALVPAADDPARDDSRALTLARPDANLPAVLDSPARVEDLGRLKVFVSCAKEDASFADQLVLALEERGFEPLMDRLDVHGMGAERVKDRLRALLFRSDTLVFVLTARSATAPICAWQVAEAQRLGKRLIPVAPEPLDKVKPPAALQGQQAILFYPEPSIPGSGFYDGVLKLDRALRVDLAWIREATRLAEAAQAWTADGRTDDRLLRGQALADAEAWRLRAPAGMEIRATTLAFIAASADAEAIRRADFESDLVERRRAIAVLAAEQEALTEKSRAEAAVRHTQVAEAQERERKARASERAARTGLAFAVVVAAAAIGAGGYLYWERQQALLAESRFLAGFAEERLAQGEPLTAMALAWEGLPHEGEIIPRPVSREAVDVLTAARYAYAAREGKALRGHEGELTALAWSPDGTRLATASADGTARLWDSIAGVETAVLRGHKGAVGALAYSPDGTRLATASADGSVRLWDAATGDEVVVLPGQGGVVTSVAWSPNGERLAAASEGSVRIWNAGAGTEGPSFRGRTGVVTGVAWSPDGARLALAFSDGTARLWDAGNGAELAVLSGHTDWVRSVAWSPDGARLATASSDGTARIWDTATGAQRLVLRGHTRDVTSVAWSSDGVRLATASRDRTARLWEAATGRSLAVLRGHESAVTAVAFGVGGTELATAAADGTARLWPVWPEPAALVQDSGAIVAQHPLTAAERCRYHLDFGAACVTGPASSLVGASAG